MVCDSIGGKMIQVIMKDGSKKRFTEEIVGIDIQDIRYQKELTEDEITKIPEVQNGKLIMRDRTQEEIDSENLIIQNQEIEEVKEKKIYLKMKIMAGEALGMDMTDDIAWLNLL
jgi:transcriptional regulator NrdR family protein